MDSGGFGDDHHAACVLVKAVDDAGALLATNAGQAVAAMRQQGINERLVRIAGGRMDNQPRRLIQHNQMCVFIQNVEGNILCFNPGSCSWRNRQDQEGGRDFGRRIRQRLG